MSEAHNPQHLEMPEQLSHLQALEAVGGSGVNPGQEPGARRIYEVNADGSRGHVIGADKVLEAYGHQARRGKGDNTPPFAPEADAPAATADFNPYEAWGNTMQEVLETPSIKNRSDKAINDAALDIATGADSEHVAGLSERDRRLIALTPDQQSKYNDLLGPDAYKNDLARIRKDIELNALGFKDDYWTVPGRTADTPVANTPEGETPPVAELTGFRHANTHESIDLMPTDQVEAAHYMWNVRDNFGRWMEAVRGSERGNISAADFRAASQMVLESAANYLHAAGIPMDSERGQEEMKKAQDAIEREAARTNIVAETPEAPDEAELPEEVLAEEAETGEEAEEGGRRRRAIPGWDRVRRAWNNNRLRRSLSNGYNNGIRRAGIATHNTGNRLRNTLGAEAENRRRNRLVVGAAALASLVTVGYLSHKGFIDLNPFDKGDDKAWDINPWDKDHSQAPDSVVHADQVGNYDTLRDAGATVEQAERLVTEGHAKEFFEWATKAQWENPDLSPAELARRFNEFIAANK